MFQFEALYDKEIELNDRRVVLLKGIVVVLVVVARIILRTLLLLRVRIVRFPTAIIVIGRGVRLRIIIIILIAILLHVIHLWLVTSVLKHILILIFFILQRGETRTRTRSRLDDDWRLYPILVRRRSSSSIGCRT